MQAETILADSPMDSERLMQDAPSGEVQGSYDLATPYFTDYRLLAESQWYVLYRARRYGRYHVLKGLRPELRSDPARLEWLAKEYAIGCQLNHHNVVRIESIEDDPVAGRCIVMEYVEGVTLDRWMANHPSRSQRRDVMLQLLAAIDYCHRHQVCHRDLKPSNILVTNEGDTLKIIDFGLADGPQYASFKQGVGSGRYAAPEQREGLPAHAEADIYAIGQIMRRLTPRQFRRAARHATRPSPARRPRSAMQMVRLMQPRWPVRLSIALVALSALAVAALFMLRTDDTQYVASAPSGQQLHYRVLSHLRREVALARPAAWDSVGFDRSSLPAGPLVVPSAITHRHMPYRVVSIDSGAFAGCDSLTALSLPDGLLAIHNGAFKDCSSLADTLRIPPSLEWIGIDAFRRCNALTVLVWQARRCRNSGGEYDYYFSECDRLTAVLVDDSVKQLPPTLFGWMSALREVRLPSALTAIPDYLCDKDMQLSSVQLPDSLRSIGIQAFSGCAIEQLTLPDKVQTIGQRAFSLSHKLRTLTAGPELSDIGKQAFFFCENIERVTFRSTAPPALGDEVFEGGISLLPKPKPLLKVPQASLSDYRRQQQLASRFRIVALK